jgi:hypothetical protein
LTDNARSKTVSSLTLTTISLKQWSYVPSATEKKVLALSTAWARSSWPKPANLVSAIVLLFQVTRHLDTTMSYMKESKRWKTGTEMLSDCTTGLSLLPRRISNITTSSAYIISLPYQNARNLLMALYQTLRYLRETVLNSQLR